MGTEDEAAAEAERRHPSWHDNGVGIVQGSRWRAGFIAGAEWARKQTLEDVCREAARS